MSSTVLPFGVQPFDPAPIVPTESFNALEFLATNSPIWTIIVLFVAPVFIFATGLLIADRLHPAGGLKTEYIDSLLYSGKHQRVRTSVMVEVPFRDTTTSFYLGSKTL